MKENNLEIATQDYISARNAFVEAQRSENLAKLDVVRTRKAFSLARDALREEEREVVGF